MNLIGMLIRVVYSLRTLIFVTFLLAIIGMIACVILFGLYVGIFIAESLELEGISKYACIAGAVFMFTFPYILKVITTFTYEILTGHDDDDDDENDAVCDECKEKAEDERKEKKRGRKRIKEN